jgi:steroid delta-isomerase-like uncharacterized protein
MIAASGAKAKDGQGTVAPRRQKVGGYRAPEPLLDHRQPGRSVMEKAEMGQTMRVTRQMSAAQLRRFILEYTDACWNKHDIDAMTRYHDPGYVHHDVSRPDVLTLAHYQQWGRQMLAAFPDFHVHADDVIAEGEKAVKRWTASGLHRAALAGIPPTGRRISFSGISVYRMAGGRIAESWYVYDLYGLLHQLSE